MSLSPQSVSVKGVLFRTSNGALEVLLLRNDRNEWELPGGRIEGAESHEKCLSREFLEETALVVEVGPPVHQGILTVEPPYVPAVANISISAYGCRRKEPAASEPSIVLSTEHNDARWIPVSALPALRDLPEIYKTAILNWKRELELRL
jgi:8-oxo-dGTP pyrophosphatase MutT (NUDIX family)